MHGRTAGRTWPLVAARLGFIVCATALTLSAQPAPAADAPPATGSEARIKVTPFPPSVQIDTNPDNEDEADSGSKHGKRRQAVIRIDSDRDFESFKDAVKTAPWIVGLVFLVVGSIFLTPVILLVGIVWYKLRKTRMQNEALLKTRREGRDAAGASRRCRVVGRHAGIDRRRARCQPATFTSRRLQPAGGSSGPTCARGFCLAPSDCRSRRIP